MQKPIPVITAKYSDPYLGLRPLRWYSSSSTFILPPPQDAPMRKRAKRELSSWAQIRSRSSSSSDGSDDGWSGTLSQGAPKHTALCFRDNYRCLSATCVLLSFPRGKSKFDIPCCFMCIPHFNFWTVLLIFIKHDINVMPGKATLWNLLLPNNQQQ